MAEELLVEPVIEPVISEEQKTFEQSKAYKDLSNDMFKYKAKLRETELEVSRLKSEKEAVELQTLRDNQEWKLLYEKNQAQLDDLNKTRSSEKEQFISYHKKNAVVKELGGFKKDEYANTFINTSNIELDEQGNVNQASLIAEVNRIKQSYPELIKGTIANNLPNEAPKGFVEQNKEFSLKMNAKERADYKMNLLKNK
jgi:hypothetical protein